MTQKRGNRDAADILARALQEQGFFRAPVPPRDINAVAAAFGITRAEQNSRLASYLSGTTNKRRREYRSALRRVNRWRARPG